MSPEERQEIDPIIERASLDNAERYYNATDMRHGRVANMVNEPDQFHRNLRVIERDSFGKARFWIYGPYMLGQSPVNPDFYYAELLIGTSLFGEEVYCSLPGQFHVMPLGALLDEMDKAILDMKRGVKLYVPRHARRPGPKKGVRKDK